MKSENGYMRGRGTTEKNSDSLEINYLKKPVSGELAFAMRLRGIRQLKMLHVLLQQLSSLQKPSK